MNEEEIINIYNIVQDYHKKYLYIKGVKLPSLKDKFGRYTKSSLVLIYLAKDYPNTKIVSKDELTKFIQNYYPNITDVQQARHLSMQQGFYIISGTRGDDENLPKGSYKLISLEKTYRAFSKERRIGFNTNNFEKLKKTYNYRCATCGSKEGKDHFFRKGVKVKLQKGHINPSKPLISENIIPQCQICNRSDRNRWIYDKTGRVIEIANTEDGMRVVLKFIKKASLQIKTKLKKLLD